MNRIVQLTMRQLIDATDINYLHRGQKLGELNEPRIVRAFANTLIFQIPSSDFINNHKYWHVYLMFEDFKLLANDKDISLEEAIEYVIEHGDIHASCDCPAYKYWAHEYYGTQLDYTYGPYRNNMAPTQNNTQMKSMIDKHQQKVFEWVFRNKDEIVKAFSHYYEKALTKKKKSSVSYNPQNEEVEEIAVDYKDTTYVDLSAQEDTETTETQTTETSSTEEIVEDDIVEETEEDSSIIGEEDGDTGSDEL